MPCRQRLPATGCKTYRAPVPVSGLIRTRGTSSQQWSSSMSHALQALRRAAAESQDNLCYYCRCPMWHSDVRHFSETFGLSEPQAQLLQCTAEHLQAKRDGGRNTKTNVVAACRFCNTRRHARPKPLEPDRYRQLVQRRLASGRWLAGLLGWSGRAAGPACGNACSESSSTAAAAAAAGHLGSASGRQYIFCVWAWASCLR